MCTRETLLDTNRASVGRESPEEGAPTSARWDLQHAAGGDPVHSPRVGFLSVHPDFSGQSGAAAVENVTLTRNTLKVCLFYYCLPMQTRTRAAERQDWGAGASCSG